MQRAEREPAARQGAVDRGDPERQYPMPRRRVWAVRSVGFARATRRMSSGAIRLTSNRRKVRLFRLFLQGNNRSSGAAAGIGSS